MVRLREIIPFYGPTIQLSEILFHLPREIEKNIYISHLIPLNPMNNPIKPPFSYGFPRSLANKGVSRSQSLFLVACQRWAAHRYPQGSRGRNNGWVAEVNFCGISIRIYPLVNKQFDPENEQFIVETSLPTPIWQGRTVNLPKGKWWFDGDISWYFMV